jgi:ribonuclease P protein component
MIHITTWPFRRPEGARYFYETNLSTEQYTKKTDAWFSCPHADTRWAQCAQAPPRQRAQEADSDRATQAGAQVILSLGMSLKGTERFPKTARLRKRAEFLKLSRAGSKIQTKNFVIINRPNDKNQSRLGVTVSGKVGNSVVRNRIKRQVREFFRRRRVSFLPATDFVIIARKSAASLAGNCLAAELESALTGQRNRRKL